MYTRPDLNIDYFNECFNNLLDNITNEKTFCSVKYHATVLNISIALILQLHAFLYAICNDNLLK